MHTRRSVLGALGAAAFARPADAASPYDGAKVAAAVAAFAKDTNPRLTPGISAAVMMADGRAFTGAAGWADVQRRLRMRPQTRLMSGSTGKTFCAATAMTFVEEGRIGLNEPLAPRFADEPWFARLPNARSLTLGMLLRHGQGWKQFLDDPDWRRAYILDSMAGRDIAYSPRKMLSFILDERPLSAPDREHHYTDLGYHLVGITLEKMTGRSYYDLMRERVLSRMPGNDVVPSNRRDIPGLACGYARGEIIQALSGRTGRSQDMNGVLRRDPSLEYTGGGLALSPRSLAQFFRALGRGEIVKPASLDVMMRSGLPVPTGPGVSASYGLGMFVVNRPRFGRYISHSGYYPGYNANVAYFLDHGFAAAVQQNTDHGPDINDQLRKLAGAVIDTLPKGAAA